MALNRYWTVENWQLFCCILVSLVSLSLHLKCKEWLHYEKKRLKLAGKKEKELISSLPQIGLWTFKMTCSNVLIGSHYSISCHLQSAVLATMSLATKGNLWGRQNLLYRCVNWGPQKWNILPRVTELFMPECGWTPQVLLSHRRKLLWFIHFTQFLNIPYEPEILFYERTSG